MGKNSSKTVGMRVKARRLELNMTMDDLAKKMGYKSRASIARIENGENNLPLPKVQELAEALATTPQYLMGWEDDSDPDKDTGKQLYYLDPKTADIAQEIFDDPDLHALFDAAQDSQPNDLSMAADLLKRLKQTNK